MDVSAQLSVVVLSCDNYSDIWDNFFDLKEKYWPDCPFETYLVTESVDYERVGVHTLLAGNGNWSSRYKYAVDKIKTPYICPFFEDFFISDTVDTDRILELIQYMKEYEVDFINMDDGFRNILNQQNLIIQDKCLAIIPSHLAYGVDTAASIWRRGYLLETLGDGDYSAWQFELDRCIQAKTEDGIPGRIMIDLRQSLNVSTIPVVIQGKYYPPALKAFKKRGYIIDTGTRKIMNSFEVFIYYLKRKCSKLTYGRKQLKYLANKLLGMDFVSKD